MLRRRNPGVVYSGKVGAKMRPASAKPRAKPVQRERMGCIDGPLAGQTLLVEKHTGASTLPFTLNGRSGRYVAGRWQAL